MEIKYYLGEIWRDIAGYEGLYQVSNLGRVRSLDYRHKKIVRVIKLMERKDKYIKVNLWKNRTTESFLVHRLVAFAFPEICGEWFEGAQVNHKNENRGDNRAENLEWVDGEYNCNYGTRNEKLSVIGKKQRNDPKKSIPVIQYTLDGVFIKKYPSAKQAYRETGVSDGNIINCCKGKLKYAGTRGGPKYIWRYA